jgi:hypothetical protein
VAGGYLNAAIERYGTVGGGWHNQASGNSATVAGGNYNTAAGQCSFAAGKQAKANHQGTFVWGDSQVADFASTAANQFLIRAQGGVAVNTNTPATDGSSKTYDLTLNANPPTTTNGKGIATGWDNYSSKRWKTNIQVIKDALEKVKRLEGVTYDWKGNGKHDIGLIAEEVGKVIPEIVSYEANGKDAVGLDYSRLVALLIEAIKEQELKSEDQDAMIALLLETVQQYEKRIQQYDKRIQALEQAVGENRKSPALDAR